MNFDELDARMRIFETAHDHRVMPGIYMVARLDGRHFTRLTREVHAFEAPFDERFRDYMANTVDHVMNCGFKIIYGYTQSDEISLLFHRDDETFGRKLRKLDSILAGEASARFALQLGDMASFDCRVSQLPNLEYVLDYFRWRQEDATRNALNGHCYWNLRKEGKNAEEATGMLVGMSVADKNELLFQHGVNYNSISTWQKRGVGLYHELFDKVGENPLTGAQVIVKRWRMKVDYDLPYGESYQVLLREIIAAAHSKNEA